MKGEYRGFTLIELMVALTVSLILLLGLTAVFVGNSRSFSENERSSRRIENGRYALALMSDGIRHAGVATGRNKLQELQRDGGRHDAQGD